MPTPRSTPVDDESATALTRRLRDLRSDRVGLLRASAIVATGYAVGAALQSTYIYSQVMEDWASVSLWSRLGANAAAVVGLVVVLAAVQAHRATRVWQMALALGFAALGSTVLRVAAQQLFGVYDDPTAEVVETELLSGLIIAVISGAIGMWGLVARRRLRARVRAAEREAIQVENAVRALEQEEIRVRREVAEGLHGTLQNKLVLVEARLAQVVEHAGAGRLDEGDLEDLRWVSAELERARAADVREMSRLLYPDRLELGLVPAVRALLGRLPASIATRLDVTDAVRSYDDPANPRLTIPERLLAVRVVEEGVTNSLKHGPATSIVTRVDVADGVLLVEVENDGETYDEHTAGRPSGTARMRQRLAFVGGTVTLEPGATRGARLVARIPLGRSGAEPGSPVRP
ncbi:sensor histidine kinase [Cellulomonas biazotea]|jgi:signal transduction histidine kinase|uniref:histidine kinase n=1 Tax=Cellulomonas biazotea TaxID=1709 RepID=A0A402DV08_9CELL|nr:ATP-binding protein [Cellulomonas biazotea]GCE77957.1 hypothetical protein CBZ_30130 [Cellulomonas biazotea]